MAKKPVTRGKVRNVRSTLHQGAARQDGRPLDSLNVDRIVALEEDLEAHVTDTGNPHAVTAAQVGAPALAVFEDHNARHENGGADEISVAGLSGQLADPQTPAAHDIDDPTAHIGVAGAVENNLLAFDTEGLPKDSALAADDVGDTVDAVALGAGVTGTFTTVDGKTITVTDGVITAIV